MARTLYRDAALADGTGPDLRVGVSVLVDEDRITWIRPVGRRTRSRTGRRRRRRLRLHDRPGPRRQSQPPDPPRWCALDRPRLRPAERLLEAAEHNARLLRSAGVRWARDVGSPVETDPVDGRTRALALGVRDRWAGHREYPYVRAAGAWVTRAGSLPPGLGRGGRGRRRARRARDAAARRRRRPGQAVPRRPRPGDLPLHRRRGAGGGRGRASSVELASPRTRGCCRAPGCRGGPGRLDRARVPAGRRRRHGRWRRTTSR